MKTQCVSCTSWGLKSPHTELQAETGQAYQTASHGRRALQLSAGSVLLEARGESAHCLFQLLEAPASTRLHPPPPVTGSPSHILPPSEPTPPPCHRTLVMALGPADHQHALPFKTLIQSRLLGRGQGRGAETQGIRTRPPWGCRSASTRSPGVRAGRQETPAPRAWEAQLRSGQGRRGGWGARRQEP